MTAELRKKNEHRAVQASHLIEMIARNVPLRFPSSSPDSEKEGEDDYETALASWQRERTSEAIWKGLERQRLVHEWLHHDPVGQRTGPLLRDAFTEGRGDFVASLLFLAQNGLNPDDVTATDDVGQTAIAIWRHVAVHDEGMLSYRRRLWIDPVEYTSQITDLARDVRQSVLATLEVFGKDTGDGYLLFHHGFHFYTPPQWALFQILRRTPGVHQVFIVHDDGRRDVYETWRRHFGEQFDMPEIEYVAGAPAASSPRSVALDAALSGQPVKVEGLSDQLQLVRYATETQLIRDLTDRRRRPGDGSDGVPAGAAIEVPMAADPDPARRPEDLRKAAVFAPDDREVDRALQRYGNTNQYDVLDLTLLPIGAFLIRLHECIVQRAGEGPRAELTPAAIQDIVATGYLKSWNDDSLAALQRALPFFDGVRDADQWRTRADALRTHVAVDVSPFGRRDAGDDDVTRIARAGGNPLRLAPWLDLSDDDAVMVSKLIADTFKLIQEIADGEVTQVNAQVDRIRSLLYRNLHNAPRHVKEELESRLTRGRDVEVQVLASDLVDAVRMLVSGESEAFQEPGGDDTISDQRREGATPESEGIGALDKVGLSGKEEDVHIVHLADHLFPRPVGSIRWPFRLEDLTAESGHGALARRLLQLREDTTAIGDLYLLSLALEQTPAHRVVTLSWVHDAGDRLTNPALPIELLKRPARHETGRSRIADQIGGLEVCNWREQTKATPQQLNVPTCTPTIVEPRHREATVRLLAATAVSSAHLCPRRFALQWVVGRSAAFQNGHQHAMLFGNVVGALASKWQRLGAPRANLIAEGLWRFLTPGQRASSAAKARVGNSGSTRAPWQFVLTLGLGGTQGGTRKEDRSYAAARYSGPGADQHVRDSYNEAVQKAAEVKAAAENLSRFLPPGLGADEKSARLCDNCAVKPSCHSFVHKKDVQR
jgi:hypothetical protein